MGFFNEIKKLLFVKKSVAKSAADKTADFAKEKSSELVDNAGDVLSTMGEKLKDGTSGLRDSILEKGSDVFEKSKDGLSDVYDKVSNSDLAQKAGDLSETVGEKVMEVGSNLSEKFGEISENVGEKVLDVGGDAKDKFGDLSETVGEKVLEAKDKLLDKAQEASTYVSEKFNETMEKAEAFKAEQDAKPKREFAEDDLDASGSMLEGTDDFFTKAEKFADGDHGAFSEGKITINENTEVLASKGEEVKDQVKAAGFIDRDGDGNEIVDEAIIEEE